MSDEAPADESKWLVPVSATEKSSETVPLSSLAKTLQEQDFSAKLAVKWASILQNKLGIETLSDLKYLQEGEYSHILDDAEWEWEKRKMKDFLEKNSQSYRTTKELQDVVNTVSGNVKKDGTKANVESSMKRMENQLNKPVVIQDFGHNTSARDVEEALGVEKGSYNSSLSDFSEKELVEKASGGKALCGTLFTDSCDALSKPIIVSPDTVSLKQPLLPTKTEIHETTSIRKQGQTQSTVESLGISLGLEISGLTNSGGVSSSHQQEKNESSSVKSQSTTICKSLYYLVPKASFSFNILDLKLTDEVLQTVIILEDSILKSSNWNQIERGLLAFLYKFGSHFNAGLVHLGGIFTLNASYECRSTEARSAASKMVSNAVEAKFAASFNGLGIGATSSVTKSDGSSSSDYTIEDKSDIKFNTKVIGGPATAVGTEKWLEGLAKSNRDWAVIDRGLYLGEHFQGIWELIPNTKEVLQYPNGLAALMRHFWHEKYGESEEFIIRNDKEHDELSKLLKKHKERLKIISKDDKEYSQPIKGGRYTWPKVKEDDPEKTPIDLSVLTQGVLKLEKKADCGPQWSLRLVKGRLWCSYESTIRVWGQQLQPRGSMVCSKEGKITTVQDVEGEGVLLATDKGLFLMSYEGKRKKKLEDGVFIGITTNSQYAFASKVIDYKSEGQYIYQYHLKSLKYKNKFHVPCPGESHVHSICASENALHVACALSNKILTLSPEGAVIHSQGEKGNKLGQFYEPVICQTDDNNNMLVVDKRNSRMLVYSEGLWSALAFDTAPAKPYIVLFTGTALYVQADYDKLTMYKVEQVTKNTV